MTTTRHRGQRCPDGRGAAADVRRPERPVGRQDLLGHRGRERRPHRRRLAGVAAFLLVRGRSPRSPPTRRTFPAGRASGRSSARCSSAPSSPRSSRWSSRPRWPSASRCSSRTTRRGGSRRALGYLVDLLAAVPSVVYGLWGIVFLAPHMVPVYQWLDEVLRLHPVLRWTDLRDRPHDAHRRPRPRGHDPADHDRGQPRGLPPDAAAARGGGARAGRHPLGDDPQAVLPFGRSGIVAPHAGPRPRARRDDRRRAGALRFRRHHVQPDQLGATPTRSPPTSPSTFPESSGIAVNALIASGLVLFVITFVVNYRGARDRRPPP